MIYIGASHKEIVLKVGMFRHVAFPSRILSCRDLCVPGITPVFFVKVEPPRRTKDHPGPASPSVSVIRLGAEAGGQSQLPDDRLARAPEVLLSQGHWGWEEISYMDEGLSPRPPLNLELRQLSLGHRLLM